VQNGWCSRSKILGCPFFSDNNLFVLVGSGLVVRTGGRSELFTITDYDKGNVKQLADAGAGCCFYRPSRPLNRSLSLSLICSCSTTHRSDVTTHQYGCNSTEFQCVGQPGSAAWLVFGNNAVVYWCASLCFCPHLPGLIVCVCVCVCVCSHQQRQHCGGRSPRSTGSGG